MIASITGGNTSQVSLKDSSVVTLYMICALTLESSPQGRCSFTAIRDHGTHSLGWQDGRMEVILQTAQLLSTFKTL